MKKHDVDYQNLVTNFMTKKKQMRRAMVIEYSKELSFILFPQFLVIFLTHAFRSKIISKKNIPDSEKEADTYCLKVRVLF